MVQVIKFLIKLLYIFQKGERQELNMEYIVQENYHLKKHFSNTFPSSAGNIFFTVSLADFCE